LIPGALRRCIAMLLSKQVYLVRQQNHLSLLFGRVTSYMGDPLILLKDFFFFFSLTELYRSLRQAKPSETVQDLTNNILVTIYYS